MARRNKKGKEKKKKSLLTKLVVVGLVSYVVVALVAQQMELTNKRNELVQLQQKISEQTDANKDLERILSLGDDQQYIESIARDQLGYAYSDERFYVDDSGN